MADELSAAADFPPPRTTGGNFRWVPPTPAELQAMMPGYTIEKLLGRGGMGAVYKGIQTNLERTVAIKILPPGVEKEDPSFAERFKSEARLMAKLSNPAVVGVYDFGTNAGGQMYFAMEYVDGSDVSQMIAAQGKLPPEHALAITAHVCDALGAAHELGIVHRDIKPANVLLNMKGQVKVADFGLAKVEDPGQHGLTKTGYAMGTPDFVAPEALTLGTAIDGRADLYAVGVMLYQMLTGNIPRGAFKPASVLVPGLDPRFDPIILKAMQHDRTERHQSAMELRRDLDVILTVPLVQQNAPDAAAVPAAQVAQVPAQRSAAQKPVAKGPSSPAAVGKQQPESRKQKSAVGLYIGIAATVAVLGALVFLFSGKKPAAETDATASANASAKPAPPVKVAEAAKPPVIKTPALKPAVNANAPTIMTWRDWVAEGRAKKIFNPPNFQDDGKEVRLLKGGAFDFVRVAQDAAVRVTWIPTPKDVLSLRGLSQAKGYERFDVSVPSDGTLTIQHANADRSGKNKQLKNFAFPAGIAPRKEHTLEFRLIGSMLSLWVNGQTVGSVDNVPVWEGNFVINGQPGLIVKKLEYAVLDGVSGIPAAPSPLTSNPTASTPAASAATPTAPATARNLFEGSAFNGWTGPDGKDPAATWRITNGEVMATTPRTALTTKESFTDFDLEFEWRVGPGAVGDVFYHAGGPDFAARGRLHRLHLCDPAAKQGTNDANLTGANYKIVLQSRDASRPVGQWNTAHLIVRGSQREHWINGEKVCAYDTSDADLRRKAGPDYGRLTSGAFALSAYTGEVTFRNLRLKTPEPPSSSVPPVETKAAATSPRPPSSESKTAAPTAPADPVAIRLAEIEKQFLAAYEKQAGAAHKAAVADLNVKFSAALDRSIATVSQAGKLDEALELRNEKALIQTRGTVPEDDAADTSETLKTLRKTYRVTMTTLLASRAKNAAPLHAAYDRALAAYQEELTKAQKLDDALRVKAVREHVSTQRETPAAPQPSTPATGAAISSAASDKTSVPIAPTAPPLSADKVLPPLPKATPEEIRAVVEWCLGKGGDVMVLDNALKKRVNKIDLLPKGKLTLVEFKVDEMAMDAEGLKWLSILGRAPDLEVLFFTRNPGTMPVELLRGATKLRILGIKPTAVDDAAFAHLAGLKNLEELQLHSLIEQFTGTGLGYITENLLRLVVDSPTLTQEGMNYLPRFKKLQLLSFNNYSVRGRCLVTDAMLRNVAALPELTELDLAKTRIDGSFLVHLPTNSKLKRLHLSGIMTFKPENFAHIAKLKQLEVLGLPPMTLGNTELAAVASLRMLRELLVFSNATFTGEGFKGLKGFGSLALLELSASPVTDAGLAAIAETMPYLKSIRMAHAPEFKSPSTAAGFAVLTSRLEELKDLQFSGSGITDDWMPAIAQAKGVTYMMLTGASVTDQGVAHLMKLPLGYLRLDGTQVTDAVIPIIKTCPTLGNVPVSGTKMTDAGKAELQRVLDAHRGK